LTEFAEDRGYLRRAQRPKTKLIERKILLIRFEYLGVILFRRLFARRFRRYHPIVEPANTPRIQIPAADTEDADGADRSGHGKFD